MHNVKEYLRTMSNEVDISKGIKKNQMEILEFTIIDMKNL